MTNRELAVEIMRLLSEAGHTAAARSATGNTSVGIVSVIDNDERRCHTVIVDYAIAPRVGE